LKNQWGEKYSSILVIPGNDDSAVFDKLFVEAECEGLLHFISMTKFRYKGITFIGYPFVPPTPFQLKDREKYDVSRFVDPGCLPPDVGRRTVVPDYDLEYSTIAKDLELFSMGEDMNKVIFLFHCPPYQTPLDRAALDGQMFDHVPLDVHIGSIAIRRFIEEKQPFMTLHGHVHESFRITGAWKTQICKTLCYSAASDKPWLCVVSIDTEFPEKSSRHELE
jgi:Icc-related predicted phosphoesterase